MISIQTNVNSLVAQQNLSVNSAFQSKTIAQLTSGYRINQSGDDAAGLAVANKFRSSVAELTQGVANGNDAVAQLQIMDGGMSNISQILDRLKTLATQSASGAFTGNRATLNAEFQTDLAEIDRQAQSIGLDTGGTFAKSLSVYLGQGSGSGAGQGGTQALMNASVVVDLSRATVDSGSLGLKGLKAIAGTVDSAGTDIGTGSSNGTTVQDIVSARAGNTEAKAGYATFNLSGPGFSDNSKVAVSANLSGVSDVNGLVVAINSAISNAGNGATQSAQALKSAGVVASVNTDQYGHQQLAFSSASTAFQVQAGDQMANALMGNFASPGSATGKAVTSTVTGGTAGVGTAAFDPTNVSVQISGAGLAGPVTLKLSSSDHSVSAATGDLINQVKQSKELQDAGISVSLSTSNKLEFSNANGSTFNVASAGDTANALGLGTFVTTSALNGAVAYSDITAGTSLSAAATGNGIATLGFSLNGGATGGITAATVTGSVTGTGYNGGGTPNGTVSNAAGGLGAMTLMVNSTAVTVDFSKDANQSATETVQQAADFINSQIQSQANYGSDVKLATVDSATKTIKLSGPADGAGTIVASSAAATALGLTDAAGAHSVAASGVAGNTVSVNLAGGNASSAVATGTVAAPANIATGTNTLKLVIDGVDVNADFTKDVNGAGKAAAFTSGKLADDADSTMDLTTIQGGKGTLSSGSLGTLGATSLVTSLQTTYAAKMFNAVGSAAAGGAADNATAMTSLAAYEDKAAKYTGASLGLSGDIDAKLASLDLTQFATTKATATGGSFGIDMNAVVDLSKFAATKATTTSTVALPSSGLDYSSWAATNASMTGLVSVAPDDVAPIAAVTALNVAIPDQKLTINGTAIDINAGGGTGTAGSLEYVASKITALVANVTATANNGVLTLTSTGTAGLSDKIDVVSNTASAVLGLTTAGAFVNRTTTGTDAKTLNLTIDGKASDQLKKIDLSGCHNLTEVVAQINHASNGMGAGTAKANADGTITLTGTSATLATGKVDVSNTEVSNALGFTTGSADNNNKGTDATKLRLNLDGKGEKDVDVSGATTIGQVATKINAFLTSAPGYGSANWATASGDSGALAFSSFQAGNSGEVHVYNDAVSQALKLTSVGGGDLDNFGHTGVNLEITIDGNSATSIDISGVKAFSTATVGLKARIETATGVVATLGNTVGTDDGSLILTGTAVGATAGKIKITDNAVSRLLGLTTPGKNVDVKGTDAVTLDVQIDGGKLEHLRIQDFASYGTTTLTTTQLVAGINTALHAAGTAGDGYKTTGGDIYASTDAGGIVTLKSLVNGGGITIKDNTLSRFLKLTDSVAKKDVVYSRADQTLNLEIDGKKQVNIALDSLGDSARLVDIADAINNSLKNNSDYGARYDHVAKANSDGTISLTGADGGGSIKVLNSTLSTTALKLTTSSADAIGTGAAASTLDVSIDGGATKKIGFGSITGGSTPTLKDIAAAINTAFTSDVAFGSGYANVAKANDDGTISISGLNKGAATGTLTIANNAAGQAFGLTLGSAPTVTHLGKDEAIEDVVSFLNQTAQQTLGTSKDAKIVTLDAGGSVSVASQTKGANSSVSIDSAGTTGGLAGALQLGGYVGYATKGSARSLQGVVDELKQAFNSNTTLQQAGLTAKINTSTNSLEIKSSNGTEFRLDAWGTKTATTDADLGFGDTGKAFTNALAPTVSSSSTVSVQGASAIGTAANGTHNTASIAFQGMQFGNDDQSITIAANSAAGIAQTPLTITLQNDSDAQTGATIDSAISAINTKLQQSNNATLRSITAVQETGADGKESINFISSLSSFSVSVGSSAGAAAGDGLNGGIAKTFSSATNGASSSIAIDTQAGAQQAVTALGSAIAQLGTAQGTIGRGQNQLTYAISLATSQITNFSAAESQIRDTNVAQQAANLSKAQTLSQASIAAMAQANSAPQAVLSLLRG